MPESKCPDVHKRKEGKLQKLGEFRTIGKILEKTINDGF